LLSELNSPDRTGHSDFDLCYVRVAETSLQRNPHKEEAWAAIMIVTVQFRRFLAILALLAVPFIG